MSEKPNTYMDLYEEGKSILKKAKVREYEIDARYLLLYVFDIDMNIFIRDYTTPLGEDYADRIDRYMKLIAVRAKRVPLQYITHEQNFCGIDFYVDEHVLIPRQDTEVLVEKILTENKQGEKKLRVLDMCTGSGCIAVTLKKLGGFEVYASDISVEALKIADKNATANGYDIPFFESDMWDSLTSLTNLDIVVSNPPYIKSSIIDMLESEVREHEPRLALDGDEDGLKFYRRLIEGAPSHMRDGSRIYMEIGYDQAADVTGLLTNAGFKDIEVTKDLAGLDRVVSAIYKK